MIHVQKRCGPCGGGMAGLGSIGNMNLPLNIIGIGAVIALLAWLAD